MQDDLLHFAKSYRQVLPMLLSGNTRLPTANEINRIIIDGVVKSTIYCVVAIFHPLNILPEGFGSLSF